MTHGATIPEEADDEYACPYCGYHYEVNKHEKKGFMPERIALKKNCDNCRTTFSYYVDERGRAAAKKLSTYSHVVPNSSRENQRQSSRMESTLDGSLVDADDFRTGRKTQTRAETQVEGDSDAEARRAIRTLAAFYQQNSAAAAKLLVDVDERHRANVDAVTKQFREQLEKLIEEFALEQYGRSLDDIEKLLGGINKHLKELFTKIDELRELEAVERQAEKIRRHACATFKSEVEQTISALKQAVREDGEAAAPLLVRHRDLIENYSQTREETKQRAAMRLLKDLCTNEGIRQFLDQYYRSQTRECASLENRRSV
jgi:hypothetical protein